MYLQFLLCALGCILILFSTFWFRQPQRNISETKQFREPLYSEIIVLFLDATGYRYIMGADQDHQIFQSISLLKELAIMYPQNTFLQKTKAVPPSTDFTILSIINGVKQMHNNLDIIFKTYPAPYEDSILRKQFKSALYSSKKQDWLRMTSGEFTYIENPKFFSLENILIADMSSYQYFKEAILKPTPDYQLYITHLMGFDALGHAIQYQNYDKGMELLKLFNAIIDGVLTNLKMSQLAIIIGDHDQSKRGKHYQCSMESFECEGFIFAFSKRGLNKDSEIFDIYEPTDLSATIATLLGYHPASQNMGKIIPQFYPIDTEQDIIEQDQELIKEQMLKYLKQQNHKISEKFIDEVRNETASKAVYEIQRNFQVGLVNKYLFSFGLLLIIVSIFSYFRLWGLEELIILTVAAIMESPIVMVVLGSILILRKGDREYMKIIIMISSFLFIILFHYGYINDFILALEIQFLIILGVKYLQLKQLSPILNWKILILIFLIIISQTLVYLFFIVELSEFELKRYFLFTLFGALLLLCFVDPRIFNKGKIKVLYITMLFIFSDIIVIIQLNNKQSFIQFIFYFLMLNTDNSCQNLLIAKIIYSIINPIKIQHQIFQNHYQINMNSMIILTQEFDIGPSLISVFIGCFGLQLIGIASVFFKKQKDSIKIVSALIFSQLVTLLLVSFKILNFSQSISNSDEKIEQQISLIYNLPIQLVELLLFSVTLILITKKKNI